MQLRRLSRATTVISLFPGSNATVDVGDQFGPYTCVRKLGAGGMAETFLAVQRGAAGFEQRVCMKFVSPQHRNDPNFKTLFLREASIAASLRHSNIVGVIDVDHDRGYIVLELVDGVDLRGLLNAAPNHKLPASVVVLIALELGKALAFAHTRTRHGTPAGIVHRDISPSNVLVSYAGEIKLTDFGIARAIQSEVEPKSSTVRGKVCYMSPEQTRGDPLDERSDLFSLGIVCYELLAGRRPFDGQTDAETIVRLSTGDRVPLVEAAPDVPGGLALVVEKLLAVEKKDRFASADALIDALARFSPGVITYRQLGDFARDARPHETLSTAEVPDVEKSVEQSRQWRARRSAPAADPSAETQPAGGRRAGSAAAGKPFFRAVSRGAWAALGLSSVLLGAVAIGWFERVQPGHEPARATAHATATPPALPPSAAARSATLINPGRIDAPATRPSASAASAPPPSAATVAKTGEQLVHANAALKPSPQRASSPAKDATPTPPDAEHAARAEAATLRIGTIPIGQVWVDGKLLGWSPVTITLPAGRHTLEGGSDSPLVHKEVRVRAGEHRQLVLEFTPSRNPEVSDATLSPPAR